MTSVELHRRDCPATLRVLPANSRAPPFSEISNIEALPTPSSSVPSTVKCSSDSNSCSPRLAQHARKECLGDGPLQQPVPVLAEHRRHPHGAVIHVRSQDRPPAREQEVVIELLHARISSRGCGWCRALQQQGPQQLAPGRSRGDRIRSNRGQPLQKLGRSRRIGRRKILGHPLLGAQVAEHRVLLRSVL